jgi:hypothetical protein
VTPLNDLMTNLVSSPMITSWWGMTTENPEYLSPGYLTDYEAALIFVRTYIY